LNTNQKKEPMETITTTQELTTLDRFAPFEAQAKEWMAKAELIKVTDVNQVDLIKGAKEARLALRRIRIDIENTRVELKDEYLRKGNEIQSIANRLKGLIEPIESHLKEQEDFEEIQKAKIKKELFDIRLAKLRPLMGKEAELMLLAEMTENAFMNMLSGAKLAKEQNEREAEQELERLAQVKKQKEIEEARLREENTKLMLLNARLKRITALGFGWSELHKGYFSAQLLISIDYDNIKNYADHQFDALVDDLSKQKKKFDLQQEKIKDKADEKAHKERLEKKRLEEELQARKDSEEAEKKRIAAEGRKARRAPDKIKLLTLAEQIELLPLPELKEDESKEILLATQGLLAKVVKYLKDKSETL
jgi:hypothetical protein